MPLNKSIILERLHQVDPLGTLHQTDAGSDAELTQAVDVRQHDTLLIRRRQ